VALGLSILECPNYPILETCEERSIYQEQEIVYSLRTRKESRFGQRHGLQNTTLTFCFYKNIYQKVICVYFYESIFQDKSIHIIFTFSNSTTWELFMIYIPKVWLKPYPKRLPLWVRKEYMESCTMIVLLPWGYFYSCLNMARWPFSYSNGAPLVPWFRYIWVILYVKK
jgi:hypothetical protein